MYLVEKDAGGLFRVKNPTGNTYLIRMVPEAYAEICAFALSAVETGHRLATYDSNETEDGMGVLGLIDLYAGPTDGIAQS